MDECNDSSAIAVQESNRKHDRLESSCADEREVEVAARSRRKIAQMDGHHSTFATTAGNVAPSNAPKPSEHHGAVREPTGVIAVATPAEHASREVAPRPYPYYFYRDFSGVLDPDPLTPLTAPGRVPNFPAKMHSILSRSDLSDIVAWMPHGRSWRVLKPREFEIRVIPTYFEHAKFSSFIRQANGWGFRRITQGRDRNSYYHEMFLRGLPHLCKMMKRPGVSEKQAADPDQEPDFYKIAEENPVPDKSEDDSILLQCTLQGGPKARMPIYFGALTSTLSPAIPGAAGAGTKVPPTMAAAPHVHNGLESSHTQHAQQYACPSHQYQQDSYSHHRLENAQQCEIQMNGFSSIDENSSPQTNYAAASPSFATVSNHLIHQQYPNMNSPVAFAPIQLPTSMNEYSRQQPVHLDTNSFAGSNGTSSPPLDSSDPASQYAAGFAAATALSQQQLRAFLGQALASVQNMPAGNLPSSYNAETNPATITHRQQQQGYQQQMQVHQPSHHQTSPPPTPLQIHHAHSPQLLPPHHSDQLHRQLFHQARHQQHSDQTSVTGHSLQGSRLLQGAPLMSLAEPSHYGDHVECQHVEREQFGR